MRADKVVRQTLSYIEEHIEEALSLDTIAAALNYSKFYLARTFAEETGCTIYKYIQGRRLTRAAEKLVKTQQPIVEIAYEAQYNSQQAFTLAFGRLYQVTPQAYRRKGVFYPMQPKMAGGSSAVRTHCRKGGVMAA
ncbi:MAG: AraC family transcriptional regulator [Lachnospiraceae bacterium]|nr:AraC family transcriptional regulator [Lachnospiraceae bacterium]